MVNENRLTICSHDNCTGCNACVNACPKNCINLYSDDNGFKYPIIDSEKCVKCNRCRKVCPVNNKPLLNTPRAYYMGWNVDDNALLSSSSGGFFSALARVVIEDGGYVVGVAYCYSDNIAEFKMIHRTEDISLLQKSKYFQAEVKEIYKDVLDKLKHDKFVLFSGTPCQVAGLKNYLELNQCPEDLLLTVELICHGVTSKKVIDNYVCDLAKSEKKVIDHIEFRHKDNGWALGKSTNVKIFSKDGSEYPVRKNRDFFFKAFNNNVILRESCYRCSFAIRERSADMTMGDYWRVDDERISAEQLRKGVSAILFNTEKAVSFKKKIEKCFVFMDADAEDMISHNQTLSAPSKYNSLRPRFFSLMNKKGYYYAFKRCFTPYYIKLKIYELLGEELVTKIKRKNKT